MAMSKYDIIIEMVEAISKMLVDSICALWSRKLLSSLEMEVVMDIMEPSTKVKVETNVGLEAHPRGQDAMICKVEQVHYSR